MNEAGVSNSAFLRDILNSFGRYNEHFLPFETSGPFYVPCAHVVLIELSSPRIVCLQLQLQHWALTHIGISISPHVCQSGIISDQRWIDRGRSMA
jgi:hypothetical protein